MNAKRKRTFPDGRPSADLRRLWLASVLAVAGGCGGGAGRHTSAPGQQPDWEYRRHLSAADVGVEVWEPEGTTPEGRRYRVLVERKSRRVANLMQSYDGKIVNQWVTDLDRNGQPEIVLFIRSFGTGSYGEIAVYEWDGKNFWPASDVDWRARIDGYMGHDEVAVDGDRILRIFPIYRESDGNADPTGGRLLLTYRYRAGVLRLTSINRLEKAGGRPRERSPRGSQPE